MAEVLKADMDAATEVPDRVVRPSFARLKITSDSVNGKAAHVELDGVDVSHFVKEVVLHPISAEDAITATLTVFVGTLDVDVLASVKRRYPQYELADGALAHANAEAT